MCDVFFSMFVHCPDRETDAEKGAVMFDGNGYTAYFLPKGKREVSVRLDRPQTISGFRYMPDQNRTLNSSQGYISSYRFYVDGKLAASGEFSNIKANPIEQEIRFAPVKGSTFKLVSVRNVDDMPQTGIGELSVITE